MRIVEPRLVGRRRGASSTGRADPSRDKQHSSWLVGCRCRPDVRRRLDRWCPWNDVGVPLEFRRCSAGKPPASELMAALLEEYDVIAGRALSGGPSATPSDFSPPGGVFVVGFLDGVPACCGGVKALGDGAGELKRMYVVPEFRARGFARALIRALEDAARDLGHRVMRLDSTTSTWPIYEARAITRSLTTTTTPTPTSGARSGFDCAAISSAPDRLSATTKTAVACRAKQHSSCCAAGPTSTSVAPSRERGR